MEILPSILSADFARLADEIKEIEQDVSMIHIDVMDGHFVPNITMGANVVLALKKETALTQDVHLMVEEPIALLPPFLNAGADRISVHIEACKNVHRAVEMIKKGGAKAGIAVNPATSAEALSAAIEDIDYVLIMTVDPGFGGQPFIPSMVSKIKKVHQMIEERGLAVAIEVDGGIDATTLPLCYQAGASLFVAGSSIFGQKNRHEAVKRLRQSV